MLCMDGASIWRYKITTQWMTLQGFMHNFYCTKNKKEKRTFINCGTGLFPTCIQLVRSKCPVQCSSDNKSSALPVYSTICLNIIHRHMVQSSLQILNATCCIQTVTFSFNSKASSFSYPRAMVLKQANIATLRTCSLRKDTSDADGVSEGLLQRFLQPAHHRWLCERALCCACMCLHQTVM